MNVLQCKKLTYSIVIPFLIVCICNMGTNVYAQEGKKRATFDDDIFEGVPGFETPKSNGRDVKVTMAPSQQQKMTPFTDAEDEQPLDIEGVKKMKSVEIIGEGIKYTLGPEDVLQIQVRNQPDFSGYFVVGPEGYIQYNWCGDIQAEGLTKEELKNKLRDKLKQYVRFPEVSVSIVEYNSKAVYIVGSVNKPGKYPMKGDTITLRDALVLAGLPTEESAMGRAKIIRETEDGPQELKVDLKDLLYEGALDFNYELQPGDIVYVPMSRFVKTTRVMQQTFGPAFQAAAIYSMGKDIVGSDDN